MNNVAGRLEKETQFYENMKVKLQGMPKIIGEYYTSMRANRKSYITIKGYINHVLHFARFITDGDITEDFYKHVGPSDIENYMISLETKKTANGIERMGDDALQGRWSSLNSFFNWCLGRGYIEKNPMMTISRPKNNTEHKVTYLTKAEIGRLFKAIDKNPNRILSARDKTFFSLAFATGMRVSALVNINKEDIDWENNVIRVIEKRQKIREIPIGPNIASVLKDWIAVRDNEFAKADTNALFISQKNSRLSADTANDALKKYCKEANINKKITMHKTRSTAAMSLTKAGVPLKAIQKQLGHSNVQTTFIYIDTLNEDMDKAKSVLDTLF